MRPALTAATALASTLVLAALAAAPATAQTRPNYGGGYQAPAAGYDDDAPPPPASGPSRDYRDGARDEGRDDGGRDGGRPSGYGASAPADQAGDSAADLVRQLNLRPDQRSAFHDYQTAFQSTQNEVPLDDPSRLQGMTAPQRLDATGQQMERDRGDFERISGATRRFYAGLDPAQRRTFDRLTAPPAEQDDDNGANAPRPPAPPRQDDR